MCSTKSKYWYRKSATDTNIQKNIGNTNTRFQTVQYFGSAEKSIVNTISTNTILQY